LTATIAGDKKKQAEDRATTAVQVNTTSAADQAKATAENTFNTAHENEQAVTNRARMHAGKAQLAESKVSATDSYVSVHRGKLHMTSCDEEKKFAFDVCFGRATYKGQLYQTKQAKEARVKAAKGKKLMAADAAIVDEDTKVLKEAQATEDKDDQMVSADEAKLEADTSKKAAVEAEIREELEHKAAVKAQQKKAALEEEAKAALAGAATGSAAMLVQTPAEELSMYQMEGDLYAELIQDEGESEEDFEEADEETFTEDAPFGRHLLATKKAKSDTCRKDTNKAFGSCKTVVNDAYAGCTRLFQKAMGQ